MHNQRKTRKPAASGRTRNQRAATAGASRSTAAAEQHGHKEKEEEAGFETRHPLFTQPDQWRIAKQTDF